MAGVVLATIVLLGLLGLGALVLLAVLRRFGMRHDLLILDQKVLRHERTRHPAAGRGHKARLVFAEVTPEVFAVDGVLESGAPLSLRLRRPPTWWFAECVGELLCGWAETDEVVELRLDIDNGTRRANLSNGSSAVTLDLDYVEGLPAAA